MGVGAPRSRPSTLTMDIALTEPVVVEVNGIGLPVRIRRNARARRMILRLVGNGEALALTLPSGVPAVDGLAMVERERPWIASRLRTVVRRQPFADGVTVPFLGEPHVIRRRPERSRGVVRQSGEIEVGGPAEFLPGRLTRWLREAALSEFGARSTEKARCLGRPFRGVRVRDMRSRWGSCSARGDLSYNWRLIMAPPFVVDYVAAHEVAHLQWRDHAPAFWATVDQLAHDVAAARRWLRAEGNRLLTYG